LRGPLDDGGIALKEHVVHASRHCNDAELCESAELVASRGPEVASGQAEIVTAVAGRCAVALPREGRDGWFDTLRAVALIRVVAYHMFWWGWLSVVFPSIGIMFAMAGALMAASLDRSRGSHWRVIGRRLRRLLPPLWAMGALTVPVMVWHGWTVAGGGDCPLRWWTLIFWVLPITDPPGSDWGHHWVWPLWYLRTYLWLVLLSPALLWMLRRWGWRVLAIPIAGLILITAGLGPAEWGTAGRLCRALSTYGACWVLGFAHHDGRIRALPWRWVAPLGIVLMAAGLGWGLSLAPFYALDLNKNPLAQGLFSMGAVLLLLRAHPNFSWLARHDTIAKLVAAVNSRAVTIYLWHSVAIVLANSLAGAQLVAKNLDAMSINGQPQQIAIVVLRIAVLLLGIAAAVIAFGWVEDVAGRRKPRILPWPRGAAEGRQQPSLP
jgi:peptidoglycan/LPS O-acetylase OafA/YrhL